MPRGSSSVPSADTDLARHQGLTYFVELHGRELYRLLERPGLIGRLASTGAALSIAMLDLSDDRRAVIHELNARGVPVTAWLVLDRAEGYWLTADNPELARRRYAEVHAWAAQHDLRLEAVGLDLEIPHRDVQELLAEGVRTLRRMLHRRRSEEALRRAALAYGELATAIRRDGRRVETYQLPLLLDERRAGSTLLQRALGFVDVAADREVLMLYESLLPSALSAAMVDSYGRECQAIGVGMTGGGVEAILEAVGHRLLGLEDLVSALRRARRYTPRVYVFSLEGCVEAGYFEELCEADLGEPAAPARGVSAGTALRRGLQLLLQGESLWERLLGGEAR